MKSAVGLWIDHKRAVIVLLTGETEEIKHISAELNKPNNHSGSTMRADDLEQRELTQHLNVYYDDVIASLQNAEAVLLMGPGEAKGELKKRLEKAHPNSEIVIETTDKLTSPQIVAKVREHFLKHISAMASSPPSY